MLKTLQKPMIVMTHPLTLSNQFLHSYDFIIVVGHIRLITEKSDYLIELPAFTLTYYA